MKRFDWGPQRGIPAGVVVIIGRLAFLITSLLIAAPCPAQHRRSATAPSKTSATPTARQATPTFDTLLAADSYKIYGEVRGLGQLIRSPGVSDLLDPVMKLAAPPREFKTIVKWLNTHAEALMTSRMLFAAWPARARLPQFLLAIDFPSAEEAQEFEPQLREFLPKVAPTPAPTPVASAAASGPQKETPTVPQKENAPPPYFLRQAGSLVLISDSSVTFQSLRPSGSRLLEEDQNFRVVRERFSSEPLFLFLNVAQEDKAGPKSSPWESGSQEAADEIARAEETKQTRDPNPGVEPEALPPPPPPVGESPQTTLGTTRAPAQQVQRGVMVAERSPVRTSSPEPANLGLYMLSSMFIGGSPRWPEAVGAAIAFEPESYVIRTLLVNSPDVTGNPIPFIPQLVSGPALVLEAPSILPADTELFATASLDYAGIYEGMLKAMTRNNEMNRTRMRQAGKENQSESPFASYERKLGIKIKDDLLPLLGNEIALSIPVKTLGIGAPRLEPAPAPEQPSEDVAARKVSPSAPSVVIAISVKDREAVGKLLSRVIESLGLKAASLIAQTEKRDDTELVSYADLISYAFIGNFLVVSSDVGATRHVVDSYLSHQTLSADVHFRNYTRWQPRQMLGQVYISPALMESYNSFAKDTNSPLSDKMRDFLAQVSPLAEPITYALSNDGMGPLHELHLPKNLVMLMIAAISTGASESPLLTNEAIARSVLGQIASAEATYQASEGNGSYASLDQLISAGMIPKDMVRNYGYKIEVSFSSDKFEASAVPLEYGKTGRTSYFVDERHVVRGGDHAGQPATMLDRPVQ